MPPVVSQASCYMSVQAALGISTIINVARRVVRQEEARLLGGRLRLERVAILGSLGRVDVQRLLGCPSCSLKSSRIHGRCRPRRSSGVLVACLGNRWRPQLRGSLRSRPLAALARPSVIPSSGHWTGCKEVVRPLKRAHSVYIKIKDG